MCRSPHAEILLVSASSQAPVGIAARVGLAAQEPTTATTTDAGTRRRPVWAVTARGLRLIMQPPLFVVARWVDLPRRYAAHRVATLSEYETVDWFTPRLVVVYGRGIKRAGGAANAPAHGIRRRSSECRP